MPNRLADETSPYLLQHKDNPVDWYPWGEEAIARARAEDKPIFLSIGYSACHWCHVMAHESFEDERTAAYMNEHLVNIKVDREERPDLDSIYMSAVQAISGRGGWPMSVWLLPDGRPFYGGTYYPNTPRHGMPSFLQVLERIVDTYQTHREALERDATSLTRAIGAHIQLQAGPSAGPSPDILQTAFQKAASQYDSENGGFSSAPKFPPSMTLELLLRLYRRYGWEHALTMVTHTLDRMAWGGMYDQLGGGFHRYSVDGLWLVPHFEKMLYDNALLIRAYLHAYQVTGEPRYRQVVEETVAYVAREMTDECGGFYSTQDADSEGEEGKYFTWQQAELESALDGVVNVDAVLDYWGVSAGPNFEGASILWVPEPPQQVADRHGLSLGGLLSQVGEARQILFGIREERVKPGRDEKILTAWNGLMINSIAQAGRALDNPDYISLAGRAARFVLDELMQDGRLLRSYKDGRARFNGYLEDYAFFIEGLIELYQTIFEVDWFKAALDLTESMVELFADDEAGFYDTSIDHEDLVVRPQDLTDNATPSGTSAAVAVLLRMALLAGRPEWQDRAIRVLNRLSDAIESYPNAFSYLASQLDFALGQPHEIALVGDPNGEEMRALLRVIREDFRPNQVVAVRNADDLDSARLIPLLQDRAQVDGQATAYVCHNYLCRLPVTSAEALRQELEITPDQD
jgi:uncharacterized protein YyaL (SSP411 family)